MRKILVLIGVAMLVITACGGDNSGGTTTTGSTSTTAAGSVAAPPVTLSGQVNNHGTGDATSGSINVELDNDGSNYYIGPTFIKATPGESVTVHLKNTGTTAHTFTIDALNVDQEVQPGKTADVTVKLPQSGATPFYCKFHQASGMQGAFFFNVGDTVNS